MSGQKSRRITPELKAVQDERLSCRHIQALIQLQQLTEENEQLKNKVKILQNETLSCQNLHKMAWESEQKIQLLREDFTKMMNEKIKDLNESHARKFQIVLEEKQNTQNLNMKKQDELKMMINSLELENKKKDSELNSYKKEISSCKILEENVKTLSVKLEATEKQNEILQKQLAELRELNSVYVNEKLNSVKIIDHHEMKIEELTIKLKTEMELKDKFVQQNSLLKEINKFREIIDNLEKEKKDNDRIVQEFQEEIKACKEKMSTLERTNSLLELERDALRQSTTDLFQEIEYLKENRKSSTSGNFSEYVTVKRELNSLKEENMKLKSASSKTELKTLKADGSRSKRVISSKKNSGLR